MKIFDLFYLVFQSFKNRRSRVIFTVLGISIGIGTILFLVSLGYGLQKILLEKITTAESLLTLDVTPPETKVVSLSNEMLKNIARIQNVEKVSPQAILAGQVSLTGLNSEATVNLVNPDFFSLAGLLPKEGRLFSERDQFKVLVNLPFAELFGLKKETILGKKLKISFYLPGEMVSISPVRNWKLLVFLKREKLLPRFMPKEVIFLKFLLKNINWLR
jgi:ABC-type antimicrobial peptide transport system permease subunit